MENISILYPVNQYQTLINDELKNSLNREIWGELTEYINSVPFIKHLISPDTVRGYAKDRPRDNEFYNGDRIVVDVTKPHILEDMDYFRERALFFQTNGKYTNIPPNPNPKSDYGLFWKEELRRWKYGHIRESDGEWIPGQLYFYWNYSPIWLVEKTGKQSGTKSKGERVRKFPKPWLGDYLFYHYMEQGRVRGKHGKLLKTRGVGFLEPNTSILQQSTGTILVGDVKVGDMLLDRYGNDTKVLEVYPQGKQDIYEVTFIDGRTVKCGKDHLWSVYDKNKGSKNKDKLYTYKTSDLIEKGLSWKNNNGNNLYKFYVPDLAEPVKYKEQDLFISPYIMGALLGDGSMSTKSIKIASDDIEVINKIQKDLGDDYILTKDNTNNNYRIVYKHLYENGHIRTNPLKKHLVDNKWNFTTDLKHIPNIYKYSSYEQRLELVKGLMDTDGSISKNGNLEFSNSNETLIDDLASVLRSMGISCTKGLGRKPCQKEIKGKLCNIKQEFRLYIRTNINLFYIKRKSDRIKNKKIFLNNAIVSIKNLNYCEESTCFLVDNTEHLYLTNDFVPTHNSFKMGSISPCNMFTLPGTGNPNFHLASEKTFLSGDKGIWGKVLDTLDWVQEHTPLSSMRLVDDLRNMTVQLGYKDATGVRKGLLSTVFGISLKDNPEKARGIRGPLIHYEEDGLFPNLEKAWNVNRKAVEDGDISFGYMLAGGTGGTEGGSFEGSEKLFYAPDTYNVLGLPNVYDKNANPGTKCGFFWGSYLNRSECFDESTGEPDVVKALIAVLKDRYVVKYNSVDPKAITQKKAEEPITPQEAVMRTDGTLFPVADLKDYLETIKVNQDKFVSEHYTGELVRSSDGTVVFKPNTELYPIRSYDKDSQRPGCLEIFEMPRKNGEGIIERGRYIFGIDPIDADTGTSLFSIIGMDTLTDRIVCEYTGRTRLASESYEIALRLLEFYNGEANYESNLKGLFAYFEQKNALHRLCDTPQILRDMDYVKGVSYGNKAKGTNASVKINSWGRLLQAQWQLTPVENDESGKLKMHTIRNIAYLEECIAWNADGNFDRVSAAGMLFILREDRYKRTQTLKEQGSSSYKSLADDNFFKRNYKNAIEIQPKHLNMGRIVK